MVVATGFFDGVHLGHRLVTDTLRGAAQQRDTESVVVTFWPHPRTVLQQDARELRLLTSLDEKRMLLLGAGVDRVEVISFTREFSRMDARTYINDYLIGELGATAILIGYDNRIGSDGATPEQTAAIASSLGLEVLRSGSVTAGERSISSTRIRAALSAGDVTGASDMLGYCYTLHGVVVSGNRLGRTLGFPTANMQMYEPLKLIPGRGVYLTEVSVLDRHWWGMTNIGVRPTLTRDTVPVVETYIFGFDQDIYGLDIRVSFVEKIRDEVLYPSAEALREQLTKDEKTCQEIIQRRNAL